MIEGAIMLILLFCFIAWRWISRKTRVVPELGIEGKLVWIDRGQHTRTFCHRAFYVSGKLDFIFRQEHGLLGVEYKSRNGPVYESDIVQAKVAALAARGQGYLISRILIKTSTNKRYLDLPNSDADLYMEVEGFVNMVRRAKVGAPLKAKPTIPKCRSCGYRIPCTERV